VRSVRGHKPDVLVLDLTMPGRLAGLDAIPLVGEAAPATRIVGPRPRRAAGATEAKGLFHPERAPGEGLLRGDEGAVDLVLGEVA